MQEKLEVFDQYAHNYEQQIAQAMGPLGSRHHVYLRIKTRWLLKLLRQAGVDPSKLTLLDVGCGIGTMCGMLAEHVRQVHGVDISASVIDIAKSSIPNATFEHYHPPRLPCPDAGFDVVQTTCVMHHVPPPQRNAFAAELARVVRPGGFVFVFEHNPLNPMTRLVVHRCSFDREAILLRSGEVQALLRTAGLQAAKVRYCSWLPSSTPIAMGIESLLSRLPLGSQYVVAAQAGATTC